MKKLLREPLIHFVLIGIGLFIAHGIWARWVAKQDYTVFVSAAEIQRQASIFASENQRQSTDEDIQGLLFAHVEEQILMREAQRLGLDDDDTIIRRRLAQKMRFMLTEEVPPKLPSDAKLKTWFEDNQSMFALPAQKAFTHVYFSPGEHDDVEAVATNALNDITDDNWQSTGDPFIEQNEYVLIDQAALARKMGNNFASKLFELPDQPGWQGPIASSFGMHLVRIDQQTLSVSPTFEQARAEIEAAWEKQAVRGANQDRLEKLLKKYKVEVEGLEE